MWQRGGRASRDGQDGEIILLADEWVEGPRTAPPSIQKGRQINGQSSQDSQPLDEAMSIEKQNKARKLTLLEQRGKLPNFWYILANDPGCLSPVSRPLRRATGVPDSYSKGSLL